MTIHNRSLWNGKKGPWLVAKSLEHLPPRGSRLLCEIRLSNGGLIAGDAPNRVQLG
jgi:hypothetical protein